MWPPKNLLVLVRCDNYSQSSNFPKFGKRMEDSQIRPWSLRPRGRLINYLSLSIKGKCHLSSADGYKPAIPQSEFLSEIQMKLFSGKNSKDFFLLLRFSQFSSWQIIGGSQGDRDLDPGDNESAGDGGTGDNESDGDEGN